MEDFTVALEYNPLANDFWTPICAYLVFGIMLWAIIRGRYAYVAATTLVAAFGLGFVGIGPLSFAKVSFAISSLTLALMVFKILGKQATDKSLWPLYPAFTRALIVMFGVVLLKSCVDTVILGLDDYRKAAWLRIINGVALPASLLFASFYLKPTQETVEDYLKASLLLIGIWLGTGLVAAFLYDPASLFVTGSLRLHLHNNDTISTVRPVPLVMISLCWLILRKSDKIWTVFAYCGLVASLIIVVLSGTRQVALSCVFLLLLLLLAQGKGAWAGALLLIGLAVYIPYSQLKESSLFTRVDTEGVVDVGRLTIWADAYQSLKESPLTGLGYREWGEVYIGWDPATGLPKQNKDTAHGLFQDITVDHGVLIGSAFLIIYLAVAGGAVRRLIGTRWSPLEKSGAIGFLGVTVSFFFSGAMHSSEIFILSFVFYIISAVAPLCDPHLGKSRAG